MPVAPCPACGAPGQARADCPHCGAIYAKAAARAAGGGWVVGTPAPGRGAAVLDEIRLKRRLEEARLEFLERKWAMPMAFAGCWLLVESDIGRFLLRTWLSMWIHELGHAVAAWFCGFAAIPGPWATHVFLESRSPTMSLLLAGAICCVAWLGWSRDDRRLIAAAAVLLFVQLLATFALSHQAARVLISFGGDAGSLVLGSALVSTVYLPPDNYVRRHWLHWGFLAMGCAAVTDTFEEWWSARSDVSRIPFGEFEDSGALSDPSQLVAFGWTVPQLVSRYVSLGGLCLLALAALWAWQLRRARAQLDAAAAAAGSSQRGASVP